MDTVDSDPLQTGRMVWGQSVLACRTVPKPFLDPATLWSHQRELHLPRLARGPRDCAGPQPRRNAFP